MAGSYCRFCEHRCFVDRVMPADARWRAGETVHLATCAAGKAHDLERTGYSADTAINPHAGQPDLNAPGWVQIAGGWRWIGAGTSPLLGAQ